MKSLLIKDTTKEERMIRMSYTQGKVSKRTKIL